MHTRATTVSGSQERLDDVLAFARDRARPIIEGLAGSQGVSIFADRPHGRLVVVSAWESAAAMQASDAHLIAVRDEAAELAAGRWSAAEYEVPVFETVKQPPPGACMRATAIATDPTRVTDAIASFERNVVAALRNQPGFCGAALMVDPATGTGVGSTIWESRAALDATRAIAAALRTAVSADAGGRITGVAEYDVLVAGIRPPAHEQRAAAAAHLAAAQVPAQPTTIELESKVKA
jgi:quinol monooxygenase YgiN